MTDLPDGWVETTLGDINLYVSKSLNPLEYGDETFELYSVPSFPTDKPEIIKGNAIGSSKQIVEPGDVLICKINPRINRVWLVKPARQYRQIASSEWIVVRVPEFYSEYTKYYFSSPEIRNQIVLDVAGVGGSLMRAQPKRVAQYPIPLSPLNEQKRIAEKLDALLARVDSCQSHLDRVPLLLKRFRQSVLAAATSGRLTEDWRQASDGSLSWQSPTSLRDLCALDVGYAFKSVEFEESGIRLLRGDNIEPGRLRWRDAKYFPVEKLQAFRHLYLRVGDVVLAMDRPIISTGLKLARVRDEDLPSVLVQRVCRL